MNEKDEKWEKKITFSYVDPEGETTTVTYTSTEEKVSELYDLVDYFKRFLVAAGFASGSANKVQLIDDELTDALKSAIGYIPDKI
jgi:hypothetical protein